MKIDRKIFILFFMFLSSVFVYGSSNNEEERYMKKRSELEASIAYHESFLSDDCKAKEQSLDVLLSHELQQLTSSTVVNSLELMQEIVTQQAEDFNKKLEIDQQKRDQEMRKMFMNALYIAPKQV